VAALWAGSAQYIADYVRTMNSARLIGMLMTSGMDPQEDEESALPGRSLFQRPPPAGSPQAERRAQQRRENLEQQQKQIAYVEVVVFIWERIMYAVAGFLALVGLFSLRGKTVRLLHLLAAGCLLLSPAITLIAMSLLINPERGGMPPLSLWTYVIVIATQSTYGLVLLAAYTRKPQS
jgi:NADH:ubiquinone oxidoreductase subunit K